MVSAALKVRSLPAQVIASLETRNRVALSQPVFSEIEGVLSRPKFSRLIAVRERIRILNALTIVATWYEPSQIVRDCRDIRDNIYLELALAAQADAIISGDEDLLVLDPWRGIPVLSPAAFLGRG